MPEDAPDALQAVFQRIAVTRMRDMPLVNPALAVEAVNFRAWRDGDGGGDGGGYMGVLITPWCMNLIYLPGKIEPAPPWADAPSGSSQTLALPAGEYVFMSACEDDIGPYLTSSLFSPMFEFADQDAARAVAEAVLVEIFTPHSAEPATAPPPVGLDERLQRPVSRRGFLAALAPTRS